MALTARDEQVIDTYAKALAEAMAEIWPEISPERRDRLAVLLAEPAQPHPDGDPDGAT